MLDRIARGPRTVQTSPAADRRIRSVAVSVAFASVCGISLAWPAPLEPAAPSPPPAFDAATIMRGAQLAAIGDCSGCHTAAGGMPYAGGVPVPTPFGTVYGTNITPHATTGIGGWSEAAFVRAMRDGIDRDGRYLYPAFPYTHFTLTSDEDLHALYAYVMTRTPVDAHAPPNDLRFPFSVRPLLAAWNALYLRHDGFHPEPGESAQWNRGAYLVRSLGHCGGCHSPRNAMGAERRADFLGGGEAEGWYAPPLDARSPSPIPWTVDQLATYLRAGIADQHAIAGGPMQAVVQTLSQASPDDLHAIAVYIVA